MNRLCVIIFGPPGSGKGTQADLLRDYFGIAHISTGDMLRERVASGDALGREIAAIMNSGNYVPDETVNHMVEERIAQPDCAAGFILDGYPRTVAQAKLLLELLGREGIAPLVVHLRVDYNEIVTRLSSRRVCPVDGAVYNLITNPPAGMDVCDRCGSKLLIRKDDRPEVVRERLAAYSRKSTPVLEFLESVGYSPFEVEGGSRTPQAIVREIVGLIEAHPGKAA
jgi:adenylate kinase